MISTLSQLAITLIWLWVGAKGWFVILNRDMQKATLEKIASEN